MIPPFLRRLAPPTLALALALPAAGQDLVAVEIASGLSAPTYVTSPPGDASRLFVLEQNSGLVKVIAGGVVLATPFLDVGPLASSSGERGLLGFAFHPQYMTNGKVYVSYTDNNGNSVVRQYLVQGDPATSNVADPASGTVIIGPINQPFSNHNGGCIQFGPDGKLYFGLGDGGSGNDPGNRAQNPGLLLGKMLRLDVDIPAPHVPADNPFVGDPSTLDEIWALGLRNPWRFSFDRATGDLWIADVGQNAWEEVDFQPASSTGGENYGWRCMEGNHCTGLSGCTCNDPALTDPVHEYSHSLGCSITGGYVYRGSLMPNMVGRYFFADYCNGRVWSFLPDANGFPVGGVTEHTADLAIPGSESPSSFGEDANGELYFVDMSGGQIWRFEEACPATIANYCQTSPNSNGVGAFISAAGTPSVSQNNLTLIVSAASSNQPCLFYYGAAEIQVPFGDGFRCVGAGGVGVFRISPPVTTDAFGDAAKPWDLTQPPSNAGPGQVNPGDTWKVQAWYRDPAAGGSGFNLSNGLSISFCP